MLLSPMHCAITTTAFVPCNAMQFKKRTCEEKPPQGGAKTKMFASLARQKEMLQMPKISSKR